MSKQPLTKKHPLLDPIRVQNFVPLVGPPEEATAGGLRINAVITEAYRFMTQGFRFGKNFAIFIGQSLITLSS
jgi:hypothetical protein